MAGKAITMSKLKQIIRLRQNGTGLKTIATAVGISKNTVKKYLKFIEAKGYSYNALLNKQDHELEQILTDDSTPTSKNNYSQLEKLFPYMVKELKRVGVTRSLLWEEYKQQHPDGFAYSQFCYHFRQWCNRKTATMHFEHVPGDKMFIDFAGKKLSVVDIETGEVVDVEVYVAILGFSQLTYVEAITSQNKEAFIKATENALHYFGGVPKVLIPDNLKSAVHKANKYEAELNKSFQDFANHYATSVLPARSYKPRDKSLAENAVNIAYSRIYAPLRNQLFYCLTSLNRAIMDLLTIHNQKSFQREDSSRIQRFEQHEKNTLQPLAQQRYEIKKYKRATVMKNSHIQISEDRHYYSIPYRFIGKKVNIIYTISYVSVFYDKQRIAHHQRIYKRFGYTTVTEHLPSTHQFVSDWNPDKFINWASAISPVVKDYIVAILERKPYPEQAYRSCVGILSQEKKVGRQRFIKAVERATHFGAYNYKTIERILRNGLDKLDENQQDSTQTSLPFHDNIRGAEDYK